MIKHSLEELLYLANVMSYGLRFRRGKKCQSPFEEHRCTDGDEFTLDYEVKGLSFRLYIRTGLLACDLRLPSKKEGGGRQTPFFFTTALCIEVD